MVKLKEFICMQTCYVDGYYFEEGTILTLDEAPCRHFVEVGKEEIYNMLPKSPVKRIPRIKPVDIKEPKKASVEEKRKYKDNDSRTNEEIIEELKKYDHYPHANTSRKNLVKKLAEFERLSMQDFAKD